MATKFGELIWTTLQNWSPNWELVSTPTKSSWICKLYESVGSQSGVCWESVRSPSGVRQESVRSPSGVRQESVRSPSGVCQESVRSLMATKFGELIWTALQNWRVDLDTSPNWELVSSPTKSSWICKLYESVGSQSGVCWESVMSLSVVCQKSDGNQIWRADLDSSPKFEGWFGHLSKLRTGVTSNKK
jgi:hypothetical protein